MSINRDPYDLRTNEESKAEFEAKAKLEKKLEEDDLVWLMDQKRGRAMVWRLLAEAGVYQPSFNQNSMTMAFNEGRRSYGSKLLMQILAICPERHLQMQKEAIKHGRSDDGNADHSN